MSRKSWLVAVRSSVAISILALALLIGSLATGPAPAAAEASEPEATPSGVGPGDAEAWLERFFQPYPADEGALTWDDLDEEEQAAASRADEWAQLHHGHEIHQLCCAPAAERLSPIECT
jgi:hypothetical protein